MASTNQSPQYQKAESNFLSAKTDEDKLLYLDEMIRECPKHKSAESMLANLKTRRKKLLGKIEKRKKSGKAKKSGIKKEEMQAAIVGLTNTGKSSLLSALTNVRPKITPYSFTTKTPSIGIMKYSGANIQLIEVPALDSEFYDRGLVNSADVIVILVTNIAQIQEILPSLEKSSGKKLIVFNNKNNLNERKISETLKSKKYVFVIVNLENIGNGSNQFIDDGDFTKNSQEVGGWKKAIKVNRDLDELKEKLFQSFGKIRVFTKEPAQKTYSEKPIILLHGANIKDVAEKIFHGFSKQVKESFVTGPSSKFPNQKVGLSHVLKDRDVVEFRTR